MNAVRSLIREKMRQILLRYVICKLRKEVSMCFNVEDYMNLTYNFHLRLKLPIKLRHLFNSPIQIKEERTQLLNLLAERKLKTLLEIGVVGGCTLFLFCQIASPNATIVSIDLPSGPFERGYPEWRIPFL